MKSIKNLFLIISLLKFNITFPMGTGMHLDKSSWNNNSNNYNSSGLYESKLWASKLSKLDLELVRAIDNYEPIGFLGKKLKLKDNNLEKIKLAIKKGANINLQNSQKESLLHMACIEGDLETVNLLINLKSDLEKKDNSGNTPFFHACNIHRNCVPTNTRIKIAGLLIRAGINYNIKDKEDKPIYMIIGQSEEKEIKKFIEIKEFIIKRIAQLISLNDKNALKNLLLEGYSLYYDLNKNNILHIAALKNNTEMFMFIFKNFPQLIHEKNKMGQTPFELNPNMLIYLINYKRSKQERDQEIKLNTTTNDINKVKSCNLM